DSLKLRQSLVEDNEESSNMNVCNLRTIKKINIKNKILQILSITILCFSHIDSSAYFALE
ncbi:hypothetical protein WAJ69_18940, partial [Acinetobacter baumannii]